MQKFKKLGLSKIALAGIVSAIAIISPSIIGYKMGLDKGYSIGIKKGEDSGYEKGYLIGSLIGKKSQEKAEKRLDEVNQTFEEIMDDYCRLADQANFRRHILGIGPYDHYPNKEKPKYNLEKLDDFFVY
jgi:hypothetical protein